MKFEIQLAIHVYEKAGVLKQEIYWDRKGFDSTKKM